MTSKQAELVWIKAREHVADMFKASQEAKGLARAARKVLQATVREERILGRRKVGAE